MGTFKSEVNPLLDEGLQKTLNIVGVVTAANQTLRSNSDGSFTPVTDVVVDADYKGTIAVAADFPANGTPINGWWYDIATNVTDNNPAKTNTGKSFLLGDTIFWNGSTWLPYKRLTLTNKKTWLGNAANLATETDVVPLNATYTPALAPALFSDANWSIWNVYNNITPYGVSGDSAAGYTTGLGVYMLAYKDSNGMWVRLFYNQGLIQEVGNGLLLANALKTEANWVNAIGYQDTNYYSSNGMYYAFGNYDYNCINGYWKRYITQGAILDVDADPDSFAAYIEALFYVRKYTWWGSAASKRGLHVTFDSDTTAPSVAGVNASNTFTITNLYGMDITNVNFTGSNGLLYWTMTKVSTTITVNLYKDVAKTQLVATGTRTNDGVVTITQSNGSGITGVITVVWANDDTDGSNIITLTNLNRTVIPGAASNKEQLGICLDEGIAKGSLVRVKTQGRCPFLMEDTFGTLRKDVLMTSDVTAGRHKVNTGVPADAQHDRECGHCEETVAGGTNVIVYGLFHTR